MSLIFRKAGLFQKEWKYDEEKQEGQYVETRVQEITDVWFDTVEEFEDGLTFRDFIKCFITLWDDWSRADIDFIDMMTGECLIPFLLEMDETPPKPHIDDDPFTYLEIYNAPSLQKYHKDERYSFEEYWGIHGRGTKQTEDDCFYSLSYSHWGMFADVPVKLNTKTELSVTTWTGRKDWETHSYPTEMYPRLGDLINDVLADLCFCGSPQRRDNQFTEIMDRTQDAKDHPENLVELDLDKFFGEEDD
jgi:hypothetical protein